MAITPYSGQTLTPGMIVLRRSIARWGICARPVTITHVAKSRVRVADGDGDERMVNATTIRFIADTMEEGHALHRASLDFCEAERQIELAEDIARGKRRKRAIAIASGEAVPPETEAHRDTCACRALRDFPVLRSTANSLYPYIVEKRTVGSWGPAGVFYTLNGALRCCHEQKTKYPDADLQVRHYPNAEKPQ